MNKKQLTKFIAFLGAAGAEILTSTNEWEVLRFKANNQIGIIYKNKRGELTFVGQADVAYVAYKNRKSYSACNKVNRVKANILVRTLLERDGNECFYCGHEIASGFETIEHLFSLNKGGRNHICNLALAHESCNQKASHMCVVDKVKLREQMRRMFKEAQKWSDLITVGARSGSGKSTIAGAP